MSDIIITPNKGSANAPTIQFSGSANASASIRLEVLPEGQVAFLGKSGSLFSISDNMVGSLMAVSDISGLPILEVFSDDTIIMGKYNKNTLYVSGTNVGVRKVPLNAVLDVSGSVAVTGSLGVAGSILADGGVTASLLGTASYALNALTASYSYSGTSGSSGSSGISGGTANYVARFTGATTLSTGVIYDNATNVGIGTITPAQKLSVNGTMQWAQTADAGYSGYLTNASTNAAYNPAITRNLIGSTGSTYTIAHGDMDAYAGIQFGISGTDTNAGNISFFAASGTFATNESVTPVARMFIANTGDVSISSTTAGASNAGALVVAGGISAGQSGQASYFGGTETYFQGSTGNTNLISTRAGTSNGATFQYKTGATLKWFHGLRGLVNDNLYIHNQSTDVSVLVLDVATNAATFAGAVTAGAATFDRLGLNSNPINTVSTAQSFARFQSTGADFYTGTESSTSGGFFPSSTAYAAVLYNSAATPMHFYTSGTLRATISAAGDATFAGSTTSVLSLFAGGSSAGAGATSVEVGINRSSTATGGALKFYTSGSQNWYVGLGATGTNTDIEFYNYSGSLVALKLANTTGAATFAGTLTTAGDITAGDNTHLGRLNVNDSTGGLGEVLIFANVLKMSARTAGGSLGFRVNGDNSTVLDIASTGVVSISNTTAGASNAGALVVAGGLATGAASYLGGNTTVNGEFRASNIRLENGTFIAFGSADGEGMTGNQSANSLTLRTNSTTALTINSAQAATFAGAVTVSSTTPTATLTRTSGTDSPRLNYGTGTESAIIGMSGEASGLVGSSIEGDLVLRTAVSRSIRFTVDGGTTSAAVLSSTGATFAGAVTVSGTQTNLGGAVFTTTNNVNIRGTNAGIAIYNSVSGSSNNWSTIRNTAAGSDSNLIFSTNTVPALTLDGSANATFAGAVSVTGAISATSIVQVSSTNAGLYLGIGSPAFGTQPAIARAEANGYHIGGSIAGDMCIAAQTSNNILFGIANTQVATISSTGFAITGTLSTTGAATFAGAVTAGTGAAVGGATAGAGGLAFPATAVGVADANTLDDYEEGTWTPSIGGTATYTTQVGSYTKIGRQVTLWFDLTINVLGTGSTQFISGAPFVPAILVAYHSGTVYWESIAINEIALNVVCQESSGTIWFIGKSAAGASVDNQVAVIGTGARFRGTLTYNV